MYYLYVCLAFKLHPTSITLSLLLIIFRGNLILIVSYGRLIRLKRPKQLSMAAKIQADLRGFIGEALVPII